ncbi:hypothetical protein Tco_0812151 [Tanacetum coccineum]
MRDIVRLKIERELVRIKINEGNAFWNEIEVNADVSKLMLLSINLLLPVLVYAARHSLTAVRHKLMLPDITSYCWMLKGLIVWPNDVILLNSSQLIDAKTIAWNEFSSTMASIIICLATNKNFNFSKYIFVHVMKNLEGGVKFLMYPRSLEDMGEDSAAPTDSHSTPIITQPSSSKPQKKKSKRKQRKDSGTTKPIPDEATNKEPISTPSCNPPQSAKTAQAKEIDSIKKRVKQLEKRKKSDLIDETQERYDKEMLFEIQDDLQGEEVAKDKGKGKIVEPEKPLKNKDQIALDEELALRLYAKEQAELEKERVAQEEASRAANTEELDSIQAMIEADEQLAARLQAKEQEQFSIKEKSRMLVEMIAERKKFFPAQRAAEQRSKPPTKTQIRNRMCAYLNNMGGYKHNQLKGNTSTRAKELCMVKSSETRTEGSSKRAGDELESDKSKKQKIDEHVEAEKDDDQEEAEMKRHIEIVKDDEVAIDAIPLATKPPMIIEYKIDKDGRMGYFKLIRADGSSKRPEEDYERVLWGDLKVMFEPDIKSEIWRNLQVNAACAQLQLLSDYYCWKEYADRDEIKD